MNTATVKIFDILLFQNRFDRIVATLFFKVCYYILLIDVTIDNERATVINNFLGERWEEVSDIFNR